MCYYFDVCSLRSTHDRVTSRARESLAHAHPHAVGCVVTVLRLGYHKRPIFDPLYYIESSTFSLDENMFKLNNRTY